MKKDLNKELKKFQLCGKYVLKGKFEIDENNIEVIKMLILYANFSLDFNDDEQNYDLKKGIVLGGPIGTGKTKIMRAFKGYNKSIGIRRGFIEVAAEDLVWLYNSEGHEGIARYKNGAGTFDKALHVFIDDIGTEEEFAYHFGAKLDVVQDVLNSRYRAFDKQIMTYCTTNLDVDQLNERYGPRLESRFKEFLNYIDLSGPDRRK